MSKCFIYWALLGLPIIALAQEFPADSLEEVSITASKIPLSHKESAKNVIVLDREDIMAYPEHDLSQILNRVNGVIINGSFSNPGKNKEVFIRGARSQYALIMVDGVPLNDVSGVGGAFDLRSIPVSMIERIEILKSSQSTLYSSDAVSGVINIITRSNDESSGEASISYGSLNRINASGFGSLRADKISVNAGISYMQSDGISEAEQPENVATAYNRDGFDQFGVDLSAKYTPVAGLSLNPFYRRNSFAGSYDEGAFTDGDNTYTSLLQHTGIQSSYQLNKVTINGLYHFVDMERIFNSSFGENEFSGTNHTGDVFATFRLNDQFSLTGGIYLQQGTIPAAADSLADPEYQLFDQYLSLNAIDFYGFNAELGYRRSSHDSYGINNNVTAAASYRINDFILHGAYTTGFKIPTLDQLFGAFGPNPDLLPEESTSVEGGVSYQNDIFSLGVTYFIREIDNIITFDFGTGYQNQNRQDDQGIEAEFNVDLSGKWSISTYYNFTTGETITPDSISVGLIRVPRHRLGMNLQFQPADRLRFNINAQYFGEREDLFFDLNTFTSQPVTLDPYILVNVAGSYLIKTWLQLFADVKNLTNSQYYESYGFSTLGINGDLGVRMILDRNQR